MIGVTGFHKAGKGLHNIQYVTCMVEVGSNYKKNNAKRNFTTSFSIVISAGKMPAYITGSGSAMKHYWVTALYLNHWLALTMPVNDICSCRSNRTANAFLPQAILIYIRSKKSD